MVDAVMKEVDTYVAFLQNMVSQYMVTRTIMDLSLEAERRPGEMVSKRRLEQGIMDLLGEWGDTSRSMEVVEEKDGSDTSSGMGH